MIYLGQGGYFYGTDIFSDSTIHWNGTNTLTITLGSPTIPCPLQSAPSVATYEPGPDVYKRQQQESGSDR